MAAAPAFRHLHLICALYLTESVELLPLQLVELQLLLDDRNIRLDLFHNLVLVNFVFSNLPEYTRFSIP